MANLVPYALPGIIVASALGAVIMCLLVFRYGFASAEEDPDEAAHRLFVTRFWHALAGVCFAVAAMLATVAWSTRGPGPAPSTEGAAERVARLDEEVRRLGERLSRELAALEERLGAIEAAPGEPGAAAGAAGPEVAAPPAARLPSPAPPAARRMATAPPARSRSAPTDDGGGVAMMPGDAGSAQLRTTVHGVHVDVRSRRGPGREMVYVVRLSDVAGRGLTGADVTILGRASAGAPFQTTLQPAAEAGVYHGRAILESDSPADLRLRVVRRDKRFELSLAQGVSW